MTEDHSTPPLLPKERQDSPAFSLRDFQVAHQVVGTFMTPTPISSLSGLSTQYSLKLFAKHDNLSPIRSFKLRGALYRLSLLSARERARGVVASSTGNHGIGIAYAATKFETSAVVIVPADASPFKIQQAARLGADIRKSGRTLSEASAVAQRVASEEGRVLIDDGGDPGLLLGAGTMALEILQALPTAEVLLVPVGGGNLIAGVAKCAKEQNPNIQVIGIQSESAPTVFESWRASRIVAVPARTFAGGLAADYPGHLALGIILKCVDEIVLVSEDDLRRAMVLAIDEFGQVLEGAGAASLAALARYASRWRGKVVVAILSGGNADSEELFGVISAVRAAATPR